MRVRFSPYFYHFVSKIELESMGKIKATGSYPLSCWSRQVIFVNITLY